MDFNLSEEQTLFQYSVAKVLAEEYPFDRRLNIVENGQGFLDEHWSLFAELGWLALPFHEAYGGLEGTSVETMLLMEQFGRALMVSPYLGTVVVGGQTLALGGSGMALNTHSTMFRNRNTPAMRRIAIIVSPSGRAIR